MARKNTSGRSSRKVAMVQPTASAADLPMFTDAQLVQKLLKTLRVLKNDRAYVVLEYHQNWASVHFEGDTEPKTITYR